MGRIVGRIILALVSLAFLTASCKKSDKISIETMSDIYVDMLVADQWVNAHPEYRKMSDTTIFYRKIFKKYGYTFQDYDKSVKYYLHNPEKYQKIAELTYSKIEKEIKVLEEEKKKKEFLDAVNASFAKISIPDYSLVTTMDSLYRNVFVFSTDTLGVYPFRSKRDSLWMRYDSLFVAGDSLSFVRDSSIVAADSLKMKADSLEVAKATSKPDSSVAIARRPEIDDTAILFDDEDFEKQKKSLESRPKKKLQP